MNLTDYKINDCVLKSAEIKGLEIEVKCSEGHRSPRVDFYTSSTLVTPNNRFTSAGDDIFTGDWGCDLDVAVANYARERGIDKSDMMWWPVYAYSHGGVTYSTTPFNCRWDSGVVGFIFESKKAVRAESSVKRISAKLAKRISGRINDELSTLTQWANGEIYAVYLKKDDKVIDSMHGIYSQGDEYTSEVALELLEGYDYEDEVA